MRLEGGVSSYFYVNCLDYSHDCGLYHLAGAPLLASLVTPSFRSPTSGWPVLFFRFRQGLRPLSLWFWQLLTSIIGDNKILGEAK